MTQYDDALVLSAEGNSRPVKLTVRQYDPQGKLLPETLVLDLEIIEMDFLTQEKFMNQQKRRLEKDSSGDVTVKNFEGMRMELLTKSMRFVDGAFVTEKLFERHKVPGTTLQTLYLECQRMNASSQTVEAMIKSYAESIGALARDGKLTDEMTDLLLAAVEAKQEAGE